MSFVIERILFFSTYSRKLWRRVKTLQVYFYDYCCVIFLFLSVFLIFCIASFYFITQYTDFTRIVFRPKFSKR